MLGEPNGAGTSGSVMDATTAFSRAAALSPSYTSIKATGWFSTVVHSVIWPDRHSSESNSLHVDAVPCPTARRGAHDFQHVLPCGERKAFAAHNEPGSRMTHADEDGNAAGLPVLTAWPASDEEAPLTGANMQPSLALMADGQLRTSRLVGIVALRGSRKATWPLSWRMPRLLASTRSTRTSSSTGPALPSMIAACGMMPGVIELHNPWQEQRQESTSSRSNVQTTSVSRL